MPESIRTRALRWWFNRFPAWRGTGARVTYIADDLREIRVRLPLNRRTRNYVGTIFGGSMFGAADPMYMIMLIRLLGPEYVVWDKSATIRFRRPGRSTLTGRFLMTDAELDAIRDALESAPSVEREYVTDLVDEDGVVCATITKLIHIRRKDRG